MYGNETVVRKEEERSRIGAVQIGKIKSLSGIKRMDGVPNARIWELCGMTKGLRKMFSIGLVMSRGWRMTGLLRGFM